MKKIKKDKNPLRSKVQKEVQKCKKTVMYFIYFKEVQYYQIIMSKNKFIGQIYLKLKLIKLMGEENGKEV